MQYDDCDSAKEPPARVADSSQWQVDFSVSSTRSECVPKPFHRAWPSVPSRGLRARRQGVARVDPFECRGVESAAARAGAAGMKHHLCYMDSAANTVVNLVEAAVESLLGLGSLAERGSSARERVEE